MEDKKSVHWNDNYWDYLPKLNVKPRVCLPFIPWQLFLFTADPLIKDLYYKLLLSIPAYFYSLLQITFYKKSANSVPPLHSPPSFYCTKPGISAIVPHWLLGVPRFFQCATFLISKILQCAVQGSWKECGISGVWKNCFLLALSEIRI